MGKMKFSIRDFPFPAFPMLILIYKIKYKFSKYPEIFFNRINLRALLRTRLGTLVLLLINCSSVSCNILACGVGVVHKMIEEFHHLIFAVHPFGVIGA